MTKLILATNNKNKLREIHEMLAGTGIHALSLGEAVRVIAEYRREHPNG